jgi:hypothetical protein
MMIYTQGNAKTSDGTPASVLTRPKPHGFGIPPEHLAKADRYVVLVTDIRDNEPPHSLCELYEAEAFKPYYSERIDQH